jgi:hypothetical protein
MERVAAHPVHGYTRSKEYVRGHPRRGGPVHGYEMPAHMVPRHHRGHGGAFEGLIPHGHPAAEHHRYDTDVHALIHRLQGLSMGHGGAKSHLQYRARSAGADVSHYKQRALSPWNVFVREHLGATKAELQRKFPGMSSRDINRDAFRLLSQSYKMGEPSRYTLEDVFEHGVAPPPRKPPKPRRYAMSELLEEMGIGAGRRRAPRRAAPRRRM